MDKELAVVRDLKRRVQVASALEEAGRFDEADAIWSEMERIASSDGMIRTAQGGTAAKGLKAILPWLKKVFSPAARFEEAVAPKLVDKTGKVLSGPARAMKMEGLKGAREKLPWAEKWLSGNAERGIPSYLRTHWPAVGAGTAGVLGYGALQKARGGRRGYEEGLQEGIKEGYIPQPYGGAYYYGGGGGGPIVGPVPGSAGPDFSAMLGDIEARIRRLETKVGEIESGLMKPSAPASTPKTPEPAASTPTSSKPAGPPKEA